MKAFFVFALLCASSSLIGSSPKQTGQPKKVLATAVFNKFHTDYSITLASGFKLEVINGKRVPLPGEWIDPSGFCYDKQTLNKNNDFGTAHSLLSLARQAAIAQKCSNQTSKWNILEENIVQKIN